jgi:hypothetical protein
LYNTFLTGAQMTKAQLFKLNAALKLLAEADALVQEALGASTLCYDIHNAIADVDDEICNVIRDADEVGIVD